MKLPSFSDALIHFQTQRSPIKQAEEAAKCTWGSSALKQTNVSSDKT